MIALQDVAASATIAGVVLAIPALIITVIQLRQRHQLNVRDKMVRVYFDCTATYAALQKERAEFDDEVEPRQATEHRRRRNLTAFWDLLGAEYEFAIAELLPAEVFIEWFALLHDELHSAGRELAGEAIRESWTRDGAPFAGRIFPRFAELMQLALAEPDFRTLRSFLERSMRANKGRGLFRRL